MRGQPSIRGALSGAFRWLALVFMSVLGWACLAVAAEVLAILGARG